MATPTYDLLDSTTLLSNGSSVTFSGLGAYASDYRDLVLVILPISTGDPYLNGTNPAIQVNGDTSTEYNYLFMNGSQTAFASGGRNFENEIKISQQQVGTDGDASYTVQFFDFASANKQKYILSMGGNISDYNDEEVHIVIGRYKDSAKLPITSITVTSVGKTDDYATGSKFFLYGIAG